MTEMPSRLVFNAKTNHFDHARAPYEERLKALAIQERALGKDHPNVAITLLILGDACKAAGDNKGAREFYEKAMKIREIHFADWSVELAECKEKLKDLKKKEP
jgi:tetratricopeptide (TPR) repeat protein